MCQTIKNLIRFSTITLLIIKHCTTCRFYKRSLGFKRGVHRVLMGKPEGKRTLGRPRGRWEDNIKMDFQEVGEGCGDWMELAKDRDR